MRLLRVVHVLYLHVWDYLGPFILPLFIMGLVIFLFKWYERRYLSRASSSSLVGKNICLPGTEMSIENVRICNLEEFKRQRQKEEQYFDESCCSSDEHDHSFNENDLATAAATAVFNEDFNNTTNTTTTQEEANMLDNDKNTNNNVEEISPLPCTQTAVDTTSTNSKLESCKCDDAKFVNMHKENNQYASNGIFPTHNDVTSEHSNHNGQHNGETTCNNSTESTTICATVEYIKNKLDNEANNSSFVNIKLKDSIEDNFISSRVIKNRSEVESVINANCGIEVCQTVIKDLYLPKLLPFTDLDDNDSSHAMVTKALYNGKAVEQNGAAENEAEKKMQPLVHENGIVRAANSSSGEVEDTSESVAVEICSKDFRQTDKTIDANKHHHFQQGVVGDAVLTNREKDANDDSGEGESDGYEEDSSCEQDQDDSSDDCDEVISYDLDKSEDDENQSYTIALSSNITEETNSKEAEPTSADNESSALKSCLKEGSISFHAEKDAAQLTPSRVQFGSVKVTEVEGLGSCAGDNTSWPKNRLMFEDSSSSEEN